MLGFAGAIFVFVEVQILRAYPFHGGSYGSQALLLGLTYTEGFELFAVVSLIGVFAWTYSHSTDRRLSRAAGTTLLVFGALSTVIVYVETVLLWGAILPGVQVWQGLPGGGGYPWGEERVAYNACFVLSSVRGDCTFLNYDELFWGGVILAVTGFVLRNVGSKDKV